MGGEYIVTTFLFCSPFIPSTIPLILTILTITYAFKNVVNSSSLFSLKLKIIGASLLLVSFFRY